MSGPTRAPLAGRLALAAVLASLACVAATGTALAATVIHFQRESLPALEHQLQRHEVHALAFHPAPVPGHVHVSLNNGGHMTVAYAPAEQAHLIALARAVGAPVVVAVAKPAAASKPVHHKLRYIAAGIVIVVIIVVVAVLLVDRRRKLGEAEGAPLAPSSGDTG
jgi:hypothetical protein